MFFSRLDFLSYTVMLSIVQGVLLRQHIRESGNYNRSGYPRPRPRLDQMPPLALGRVRSRSLSRLPLFGLVGSNILVAPPGVVYKSTNNLEKMSTPFTGI